MLLTEYRPFHVDKQLIEASIKRNEPLIVSGKLQAANQKNQNERDKMQKAIIEKNKKNPPTYNPEPK